MKAEYVPTVMEVKCNCGKIHNVRTKEREQKITCWEAGCNTTIRVVLGYGRNNYSVYLKKNGEREVRTSPISVIQ